MSKRLIQYRPEWQALRVSMLSDNNELGGFVTYEGTRDNTNKLTRYILETMPFSEYSEHWTDQSGMGITMYEECQMRCFRVLNMMAAVRMGYSGQRLVGSLMDMDVANFRAHVLKMYDPNSIENAIERIGEDKWWSVVEKELFEQTMKDGIMFLQIRRDLEKRRLRAYKKVGPRIHFTRSELIRYLDLMDTVTRT